MMLKLVKAKDFKIARIRAGLTQQALARLVEMSENQIAKIETGRRPIAPNTASAIAEALGCEASHFLEDAACTACRRREAR